MVTVSATARRRSKIALPGESVEATEIAAAEVVLIDRLLGELPAMQIIGNAPTGSSLLIRGIGGAGVLVLLDGQPVTGTLIENRDLSRMSLTGSDRVEIVKGPLSSLYGSDALGGVVNVITRLRAHLGPPLLPPRRRGGRVGDAGRAHLSPRAPAVAGGRGILGVQQQHRPPRGDDETVFRFTANERTLPLFPKPTQCGTLDAPKGAVGRVLAQRAREIARQLRELADGMEP